MEKSERRRFTRLPLQQEAVLELEHNHDQVTEISNLSIGGCLLNIDGPLEAGRECLLTLQLHHAAPDLEVSGEILRSDKQQTSIRFTSISPENLKHLHNLIRYNAEDADRIDDEIKKHPGLL